MIWLIYILIFIPLLSMAIASMSLIVWVPTRKEDLSRVFELANLKPDEKFIDLGCGTGTVPRFIAERSDAIIHGIELAIPLYLWSWLRGLFGKRRNLSYFWGSLFTISLAEYDVIYVFGIPDKLKTRLRPKLERELKPGARVISYAFAINGWDPSEISKPSARKTSIYLYQR